MCLAVPGQIVRIMDDKQAVVNFMGIEKKVSLDLIEKCQVGDYVIVHAGFAITTLNREEARETIACFRQLSGHPR